MRPFLLAWLCLIISLFPPVIQSRSLPTVSHRHRSSLSKSSKVPESSTSLIVPAASVALDNDITPGDRVIIWRALLHKGPPPRLSSPLPDQKHNMVGEGPGWPRASRGRRHANSGVGRGHGQLMRVGCVLGTCQVQNLSHRLYQLIGQSGREDSSPINPRSPHSYG